MTNINIGLNQTAEEVNLLLALANRHGIISGATGTGKTATLQKLAESFSDAGIPVFTADVKGDLSGISQPGIINDKIKERCEKLKIEFKPCAYPVVFWDLYGTAGLPLRASISEMGPLFLSRLMRLNETQAGVLQIAFKWADDQGLLLLDLKDLKAVLTEIAEQSAEIKITYGNVSSASIGAIQRSILELESSGASHFFAEPSLELKDLIRLDSNGKGIVNVLDARKLVQDKTLYTTFLLWLLSELFEELPEVGDLAQPKLVFFFDEAHLLFNDVPKMLLERIEMLVRLVRSKGVGVYFVSQSPLDIPDTILAQLGNRFQHALRVYSPKDQKDIKTIAAAMPSNPAFTTLDVIPQLETGEALISVLNEKGAPTPAQRTYIKAPCSRLGAINEEERKQIIQSSTIRAKYSALIDRESAYEKLKNKTERKQVKGDDTEPAKSKSNRQSTGEVFVKSVVRNFGNQLARALMRGLLGSLKRN